MTKFKLFLCLIVICKYCFAGFDNYLLQASGDSAHVMSLSSESGGSEWQSGWVDDMEIRVQHEEDENDTNSETYSLRLRPKYGSEREAEQGVYTTTKQQHLIYVNKVLGMELRERYLTIIDILELEAEVKYLQEKQKIIDFKVKVQNSLSQSSDFDPEELQKLVLELENIIIQLDLARNRLSDRIENVLPDIGGNNYDFFPLLITPLSIQTVLLNYESILSNIHAAPEVRLAELDNKLADIKLDLQQSKQRLGIELFEVKYEDKDNSAVGITLGIRLPTGSNARNFEQYLDKSKADSRYRMISDEVQVTIEKRLSEINWDSRAWQSDKSLMAKIQEMMTQPARLQKPELIADLRTQQLTIERNMFVIHIRILKNYIELLHMTGLLNQYPLKNWLKSGLPPLKAE